MLVPGTQHSDLTLSAEDSWSDYFLTSPKNDAFNYHQTDAHEGS